MAADELDPKGLIRESYRIEGITAGECRSIFLDWALSHPQDDHKPLIKSLLDRYGAASEHPMSAVLREGLASAAAPVRRGGRRARLTAADPEA